MSRFEPVSDSKEFRTSCDVNVIMSNPLLVHPRTSPLAASKRAKFSFRPKKRLRMKKSYNYKVKYLVPLRINYKIKRMTRPRSLNDKNKSVAILPASRPNRSDNSFNSVSRNNRFLSSTSFPRDACSSADAIQPHAISIRCGNVRRVTSPDHNYTTRFNRSVPG